MGVKNKISLSILFIIIAYFYYEISKSFELHELDLNEYWGKSESFEAHQDESIQKFEIAYDQEKIKKLRQKLEDSGPFVEPLEGVAFQYGFNSIKLKEILSYWKNDYLTKWEERLKHLNQFPQFKTKIQGLDIHFIHVKPKVDKDVKVFPILLLHGWPSTANEFHKMIPMYLTPSDKNIAFEVVAPNLPGFGFSEGAARPGLAPDKMAIILRNLMLRLKYDKFYVQAGDWGSIVAGHLTACFQENVLGFHSEFHRIATPLTFIKTFIASIFPSFFLDDPKFAEWIFPLSSYLSYQIQESGYYHIQATKPDTIGIALSNNPAGLAAYILEKYSTLTNINFLERFDGGFEDFFTWDELIDNLMIYYITNSITKASRIYKENYYDIKNHELLRVAVYVPVGASYFKNEKVLVQFPFIIKERYKNIIHVAYHDDGGHFAPLQFPELLYKDVLTFVEKTLI